MNNEAQQYKDPAANDRHVPSGTASVFMAMELARCFAVFFFNECKLQWTNEGKARARAYATNAFDIPSEGSRPAPPPWLEFLISSRSLAVKNRPPGPRGRRIAWL